ncbi:NAD(P)/FAD-dependent oxidoreductase [Macrococcus armenti]|nr:NAD(P)/FAD-dependent oxidoreductase [Macrococcus armenti]UBH14209.1 NAD(P)/FAD-dependent oxidoreductase [Macrococcus armenti]
MKDVTIIGGGPAGLYASFYAGLRGLSVRIIEYNQQLGGKLNLYPEKIVWDIGAMPAKPAAYIMEDLIKQGMTFYPEVKLNEKVLNIKKCTDHFEVETNATTYLSRTVILAIGSGIINPVKLEIKDAERFEINNLHYVVRSLQRFKGKRVLISGGGNTAVDWARDIAPYAASVHIICRKEDFKGHEEMVRKLDDLRVVKLTNQWIESFNAEDDYITSAIIKRSDHSTHTLDVDEVIINHGFHMDSELLDKSDIQLNRIDNFYVAGNADGSTNIEGVYAIGDILKHDAKVNLIAGCFHDAAIAINKIKSYLDPEAESYGIVSSHNPVFEEKNKIIKDTIMHHE